jgi:hypothetical protein
VIRYDENTGALELASKYPIHTKTCALMVHQGKLWVMGESPRVQAFNIGKNGLSTLEESDISAKLVDECNQFLDSHRRLL